MTKIEPYYDVLIMGGALSGAATATLLLRWNPGIRILIVEKHESLGRRVGEATVEISAYFMGRVLGMTRYLNEHHLCKQGLRFWFQNEEVQHLDEASEIGPKYLVRLPSYQIDRSTFDEEVLRRAEAQGAQVLRPASIKGVELQKGGTQCVQLRYLDTDHEVTCRWVVDATGVAAFLARKNGWWHRNTDHPTAAIWSRWKGLKDWDGLEFSEKYSSWSSATYGIRGTATNHVIGDGWWSWWIPLKGGETSVGVVFDQRLVDFEAKDGRKLGERLKDFLMKHPVAREVFRDAEYDPDDVHWRRHLAYQSDTFSGDGFVLVGDAAAFMDPFYSPGMDWVSYTSTSAAHLITQQRQGVDMAPVLSKHNHDFQISIQRWFQSLYRDKYHYLGEWDLMKLAFRLDLGLYYWGLVRETFTDGVMALTKPPFSQKSGWFFCRLMSLYNRRFASIAKRRRRLGLLGRQNKGNRFLIPGFTIEPKNMLQLFGMLREWAWLELKEGWKSWLDKDEMPNPSKPTRTSELIHEENRKFPEGMDHAPSH